ncbi:GPI mannosyltransferase 2-like [Rhopalosiphum maidis]|uniref:GPI mannosyltransferase 2-like n=1 Tax=Rhopalosiphum maidis TaxID=43146 RepID=UPI000EFE2558|nr:GPI mannosyltransferase 2-like isoform X1 [Rhopalosiphum maidis]XP_026818014.1 GPI mannosyltransferase 2-like [Rhopalosiphum maidis]
MKDKKLKGLRIDPTLYRSSVWRLAAYSRMSIVILQYIFNALIPDHQAQGVFISPGLRDSDDTSIGRSVTAILGGFLRWDAQYFHHIYRYGYTYENTLAFFPLYPNVLRLLTAIFPGHSNTMFLIAGVIFNNLIFVFTALVLFNLTLRIHNNVEMAYNSTVLFCFNPASVFFSAPYSESLFVFTTFYGMYHTACENIWKSSLLFGLSVLNRSNGLLNVGFLLYYMIQSAVKKRKISFKCLIGICFVFACFSLFQMYGYYKFCTLEEHTLDPEVIDYAITNNLITPNNISIPLWCGVRLPYSYVQEKYWKNIGLLSYFQFKQIPNFLLASPCIFLLLKFGLEYFCNNNIIYLGLRNQDKPDFVYVVHSTFLTIFCLFCIHVQVTTRMLASSSPVFYWACANYFKFPLHFNKITYNRIMYDSKSKLVALYFFTYFIVGTALFVNFLPFT